VVSDWAEVSTSFRENLPRPSSLPHDFHAKQDIARLADIEKRVGGRWLKKKEGKKDTGWFRRDEKKGFGQFFFSRNRILRWIKQYK
jgi:hypothetical protein